MSRPSLVAFLLFLSWSVMAQETEPVNITGFQMKDGRQLWAVRYAAVTFEGVKTYSLTTTEGRLVTIRDYEIEVINEERWPLEKLPLPMQTQMQQFRRSAAATRAQATGRELNNQAVTVARLRQNDAQKELKRIADELAQEKSRQARARELLLSIPIEIARADAEYDAAKTELGARSSGGYVFQPGPVPAVARSNAATLREEMKRAAERKVRLEQEFKATQQAVDDSEAELERIRIRYAALEAVIAELQGQTQQALQQARDYLSAPPPENLSGTE